MGSGGKESEGGCGESESGEDWESDDGSEFSTGRGNGGGSGVESVSECSTGSESGGVSESGSEMSGGKESRFECSDGLLSFRYPGGQSKSASDSGSCAGVEDVAASVSWVGICGVNENDIET